VTATGARQAFGANSADTRLCRESVQFYCGCCGNEVEADDHIWCVPCREHVGGQGSLWDRTWFAKHGTDCPYQAGS
jgi:hypothetical protein